MDQIESLIANNKEDWCVNGRPDKSKLRTIMMSEMDENETIDKIQEKWDKMFETVPPTHLRSTPNKKLYKIKNRVQSNVLD